MKKLSKRLQIAKNKISKSHFYTVDQAIDLVKKIASAKFNESIEAHISVEYDVRSIAQSFRQTLSLPHGLGKTVKIAVLCSEEQKVTLTECGADLIGSNDLIEKISDGIINFDLLISTSEMMPKIIKLGRILGPKGLMPSLKMGTVTSDIRSTVHSFKNGKLEYKLDKTGNFHIIFGKSTFSKRELRENFNALYMSIKQNKPIGSTGQYFKKITLCSTMGPGIRIDCKSF